MKTDSKPSSRARDVWRRLVQCYGTKMAEQYGPNPPPDWCSVIDQTDDNRIEKTLIAVRRTYLNWPPTLPQFEACIPSVGRPRRQPAMDTLTAHATNTLGVCAHQMRGPWTYFGPIDEMQGAIIPPCARCGRPAYRILMSELCSPSTGYLDVSYALSEAGVTP